MCSSSSLVFYFTLLSSLVCLPFVCSCGWDYGFCILVFICDIPYKKAARIQVLFCVLQLGPSPSSHSPERDTMFLSVRTRLALAWTFDNFSAFHRCSALGTKIYLSGFNATQSWWSRWGNKSCVFLCHSCAMRAPAGIQAQQLVLNVDSLETTESSWGQTSVCQSPCIHGNQVNTEANCQVKLKPGRVMFQCHPKANLARW